MKTHNSHYFNTYRFFINLLALVIGGLCFVSCNTKETKQGLTVEIKEKSVENALNINTAKPEELEKLPEIGPVLAERIIAHREKYGPFRRVEHLLLVEGFSDKRFRQIQAMIKVD